MTQSMDDSLTASWIVSAMEKKTMKAKIFAAVATGLLAVTSLSAMAANLRVGTHPTFAPFEFMDTKTREYVGFDIDLIREIGKRAGYDAVEFSNMSFDGLIPALLTGSIDVVVSGMTITEERQKKVDFADPYYLAGQSLMVREDSKDTLTDVKSLEGKTIAVQLGTTGADFAKTIPNANVKSFNNAAEAFMDLRMKGADAVIADRPVMGYFMVKNPRAAKGLVQQPVILDQENFGFAIRKGNKEVLEKVNAALKSMRDDGTYGTIHKKWFGQ